MTIDISIDFENNPSGIFYAGQILSGTVRLTLGEGKKVRGVYICIEGKAYCKWSEGSGKTKDHYVGEEEYLKEITYLLGSSEGRIKLMPGTQTFGFQCNLPNELPTSVEGEIGYIRYTASVTVDIPMGFNKVQKQRFTVIRALNLNDNPQLRQPVVSPICKMGSCSSFWCCFCIGINPIEVSAQIPVGGYTSGQYINLQLYVNHKGSPKNYKFIVKLMKHIDYYAEFDGLLFGKSAKFHNKEAQCVTEKEACCRISNTTSIEIVRVDLQVPPVPPTDVKTSNIAKTTYFLSIKTSTGDCNGSPKNKIPITIGSYPIDDFVAPNSYSNATAPLLDSASGNLVDKELPTYESAMEMFDADGDGNNFKPKYPIFKRRTSYSTTL